MLMTPDRGRWKPMLMGLGLAAAAAGAAVQLQASAVAGAAMTILAFAAWVAGACAMVGCVRWMFGADLVETRRDAAERDGGQDAKRTGH